MKGALPVNRLSKFMKLKIFLWLVVYFYIFYAMIKSGPSAELCILLAAAILVSLMQVWRQSNTRRRLREDFEKKNKRKDD